MRANCIGAFKFGFIACLEMLSLLSGFAFPILAIVIIVAIISVFIDRKEGR